jgi:hypothetical protein
MAISQADFYAFSQATGAPVPEDPESRARIAPQVMEWRRNQLKQPARQEEGSNLAQTIGGLAAAAGIGTLAFLGGRRLADAMATRRRVTPVSVQVQEDVVRRAAQPVPQLRGVTQQSGAQTARSPIPRPPTQPTSGIVRDITPSSAPPRGKAGPGIVDPWSGPAPTSYRGPLFQSDQETISSLQDLRGFLGAKGRFPETTGELQEYSDYGQRLGRALSPAENVFGYLPAAEEEFIAYRPDPREFVSRQVANARRQAATESLLRATAARRGPYQLEIPGVKATLMELRAPAAVSAEETGELIAQAESRPLSAAPAQQNLFKYVQQAAEPQGDVVDRLLTEYNQLVEQQARTDQRVRSSIREYQTELQNKALRIMDELHGDSLVEVQQTKRPFNVDQAINALGSSEDQMTGRVRQQLQRNEDVNLGAIDKLEDVTNNIDVAASMTPDGVPVDQAESAGRINQLMEQGKRYLRAQEIDLDYDYGPENLRQTAQVKDRIARAQQLKKTAEQIIYEEQARVNPIEIARRRSEDERRRLAAQGFAGERLEKQLLENMRANFPEGREVMAPLQEETRRIERVGMPSQIEVRENIGSVLPFRHGDPERVSKAASGGNIRGMNRITREDIADEFDEKLNDWKMIGGGMGIYGLEPKYASGAVRKLGEFGEPDYGEIGYEYSPAAKRRPTELTGKLGLEELRDPYSRLSDEQLGELTMYGSDVDKYNAEQQLKRRAAFDVSKELRRLQLSNKPGSVENFLARLRQDLI